MHLEKLKEIASDSTRAPLDRFISLFKYSIEVIEPVRVEELDSESKKHQKAGRLAYYIVRVWGFLLSQSQVPREKWADLCPLFLEAALSYIESDRTGDLLEDDIPKVKEAWKAAEDRRNALIPEGYWSESQIWGWGEMGGRYM